MRILGLDYGKRRIGVAISDPLKLTAQSLPTINVQSKKTALDAIAEILSSFEIEIIVVGYPLTLKGEVNKTTRDVQSFIATLKERFEIEVETIDERLTSVQAQRIIRDMGFSPSKSKGKIDQIAATLILQTYLDRGGLLQSID